MAFKNSWTNSTPATGLTVTIAPAAGDILIGYTCVDSAGGSDAAPTGWSLLANLSSTFDGQTLHVVTKKATGSETSVAFNNGGTGIGGVVSFDGIDQTTWLDVTPVTLANSTGATTTDISITPTTSGCDIVFIAGIDVNSATDVAFTFTTASGTTGAWTGRTDQNSGFMNVGSGSAVQATAGAITARCTSTSAGRCGALFALRPAATGTIDQQSFRFGNDDANEAGHTWAAAQDANLTAPNAQTKLLRVQLDATGDPVSSAPSLRSQKNGAGGYVAVPVGATTTTPPSNTVSNATLSGNNTASSSWAVSHPAASTGDLLVWVIAWDDSTNVTTLAAPSGPNGETLSPLPTSGTPVTDASTESRLKCFYTKATGAWSASTLTFTPGGSEQWSATVFRVPAGTFDPTTPIGAAGTAAATGTADANASSVTFSAGASDGSGLLVWACGADTTQPSGTNPSGWTIQQRQDIGAVGHGVATRDALVTNSESITATTWALTASDSWNSIVFVIRPLVTSNECYIATSANIASGGEATTARLTAPSGKTTSDFVTGRRWDDENGTDALDITTDDYTEVEWAVALSSAPATSDYFDFRVYIGGSAATNYDVTPRWTVGSGLSATLTQPAETDTAQALTKKKSKAVGQNTETDTAQAVTRSKRVTLGQLTEADTAQSVRRNPIARLLGQISEADTAQALTRQKSLALTQPAEADSAQTVTLRRSAAVSQATETDTAQALTRVKAKTLGQAAETDAAGAVTRSGQTATLTQPSELDTAQALTVLRSMAVGQATETDAAQAVTHAKRLTLAQAAETDSAQAVTVSTARTVALAQASETDTAGAVTTRKALAAGQAAETDAAQAVTHAKRLAVGQATEADSAVALASTKSLATGQAVETDSSTAVTARKSKTLGQVEETDSATHVGHGPQYANAGQVAEFDSAQAVAVRRSLAVGQGLEVDSAAALTIHRSYALGAAAETDTAIAVGRVKSVALGQVAELDDAVSITHAFAVVLGQVEELEAALAISTVKAKAIGQAHETDTARPLFLASQILPDVVASSAVRIGQMVAAGLHAQITATGTHAGMVAASALATGQISAIAGHLDQSTATAEEVV